MSAYFCPGIREIAAGRSKWTSPSAVVEGGADARTAPVSGKLVTLNTTPSALAPPALSKKMSNPLMLLTAGVKVWPL